MPIHEAAARGYQSAAGTYERSRPGYEPEAVDRLVEAVGVGAGRQVLELAAGTGKLTRALAGRGARIVALEPVEAMRREFAAAVPGVPVVGGVAEALPFAAGSADAVVVAQAFHWFDAATALAEIARVLRPGGGLGLVWNLRDDSVDWVGTLTRIIDPYLGPSPRYRSGEWKAAFAASSWFGPLATVRFHTAQDLDVDGVVDRIASVSYIASLPPAGQRQVAAEVRHLLAEHRDTAGRRNLQMPHLTDVFWAARL